MESLASTNGPPVAPKKSRSWLWYFAFLVAATMAATTTMIVYNLRQQLTPQQLQEAIGRWQKNKPADYDMEYSKQSGSTVETYYVQVRGGKVTRVDMRTGQAKDVEPLEERLYPYHSVDALFGFMNDFLAQDARPGRPKAFVRAVFADEDGHPMRYVRSVSATRERVEIIVTKFERVTP